MDLEQKGYHKGSFSCRVALVDRDVEPYPHQQTFITVLHYKRNKLTVFDRETSVAKAEH